MDAVNDAAGHPELSEQALAGQYDIAAATRTLRADLTWLTTVADAAASIDATLAAADQHHRRVHRRDLVNEQLTRRRATLAAARAAHRASPGDLEAATRDRPLRHPGVGAAAGTVGATPGEGSA